MKLGEAKKRLAQIRSRLIANKISLSFGQKKSIIDVLEECHVLLQEQQVIDRRISRTEHEIYSALELLNVKIGLLEMLTERTDLDSEQKDSLFIKLKEYTTARDSLETTVDRCLWEIDLLDE